MRRLAMQPYETRINDRPSPRVDVTPPETVAPFVVGVAFDRWHGMGTGYYEERCLVHFFGLVVYDWTEAIVVE